MVTFSSASSPFGGQIDLYKIPEVIQMKQHIGDAAVSCEPTRFLAISVCHDIRLPGALARMGGCTAGVPRDKPRNLMSRPKAVPNGG